MVTVLIRSILIYSLLLGALRLTGKRQVGELQISELITTFMISELATAPIQDLSTPLIYSVIPITVLLCAEIIMSFAATRSPFFKKAFFGNPSIIIEKGKIKQEELKHLRIGVSELLCELRLKDVSDVSLVDYAILEQNGQLSVFLKDDSVSSNTVYTHAVVTDGQINESNLLSSGKSEAWVRDILKRKHLKISQVFLMTVDNSDKVNIIKADTVKGGKK